MESLKKKRNQKENNMTRSQLTKLIREEIKKTLNEATAPTFKAKHKNNNLVAAMYFSWKKAESNNSSFWNKVKIGRAHV